MNSRTSFVRTAFHRPRQVNCGESWVSFLVCGPSFPNAGCQLQPETNIVMELETDVTKPTRQASLLRTQSDIPCLQCPRISPHPQRKCGVVILDITQTFSHNQRIGVQGICPTTASTCTKNRVRNPRRELSLTFAKNNQRQARLSEVCD